MTIALMAEQLGISPQEVKEMLGQGGADGSGMPQTSEQRQEEAQMDEYRDNLSARAASDPRIASIAANGTGDAQELDTLPSDAKMVGGEPSGQPTGRYVRAPDGSLRVEYADSRSPTGTYWFMEE